MRGIVYLGADHAGFKAKEALKLFFDKMGIRYEDLGAHEYNKEDDYPDFAFKVGEKVADEDGRGILFCGTGTGMVIAANKVRGIRAVEASNPKIAKLSREHNDTNVLALSGWELSLEEMKKIVIAWLNASYDGKARRQRRIGKIEKYEK